ncbi:tetratricopeptide repeat-containing sulfotransferase family protein [Anianabacter salinae]|uniref:tetratricopeptide repeat-containing sulfotransferase family protein n=1 Tax=Anianabacter salinae TaxID=2851023 RepID=UPI00225DFAAE|nr:sulfotransferase [Anianabacter salinae]MBV0913664.1 sulfotransferase [Anianabacter salinae]
MIPVNPAQIPKLYGDAMALQSAGQLDAARALYLQILAVRPQTAEAEFQLGQIAVRQGQGNEAFERFLAALRLKPVEPALWKAVLPRVAGRDDVPEVLATLEGIARGAALPDAPRQEIARAIDGLRASAPPAPVARLRALVAARDDAGAAALVEALDVAGLDSAARAAMLEDLIRARRMDIADRLLARCLKGQRHGAGLFLDAAMTRSAQQRDAEALRFHDKAIAKAPGHGVPLGRKAATLQRLGRFDEAEPLLRKALAIEAGNDAHRYFLSVGRKFAADDPLIPEWETRFAALDAGDVNRAYLGFALTKALEDSKQHGRVFTYLRPANETVRRLYPYAREGRGRDLAAIKAAYETFVEPRPVEGHAGFAPIFVTGMPRSGTTLVEQILASHSEVTGGGELGFARAVLSEALIEGGRFKTLGDLPKGQLAACGAETEAAMRDRFPGAARITDKSVQTYALLGPIAAALPNAHFVIVHRDPRDLLLSCYRNFFELGQHRFAYDLADLAHYYRSFLDIVAFWKDRMPGRIHEIRYEDLIAAPEAETRKLVAACGLPWEDQCMTFHESTRRVDTLSLAQVRQPLYKSSLKAWERYGDELQELFDALGDALPKE